MSIVMPAGAPVYWDYAATTPVDPRVAERMAQCLTVDGTFGNPGSGSHDYGAAAQALVDAARAELARAVGAAPGDVVWTSGATESNNLALFGVAQYYAEAGRHIVTVRTEHKAVLDPCRELERRGWHLTYLVPGSDGILDPQQVAAALRDDTVLVSVMHVNNEIGVIQDVAAIAALCARQGRARLHVDAAQSVGKLPVDFAGWGIDLMSVSAHKAYGPKGIGALLVSRARGVQLKALHFGGGQERNLRSGTVATHQVVGMAMAFTLAEQGRAAESVRVEGLRQRLWCGLHELGGVRRNGAAEHTVPHLLNVSCEDVDGESLLAAVRSAIAVSTGAACASAHAEPSYVLRALGRGEHLAQSSLRFSFGRYTQSGDVDAAIAAVGAAVVRLRHVAGSPLGERPAVAVPEGASVAGGCDLTRPADYSELTWRHFLRPAQVGVLEGPTVRRGSAGGRAQGRWVQFDVRVESTEGRSRVADVRFLALGCPHLVAVADWIAAQAIGGPVAARLPQTVPELRERFAVPIDKLGTLLLLEDAWIAANSPPSHG